MRLRWTRPSSIGGSLWLVGTAAVLVSCVVNYAMTPYFECEMQWRGNCSKPDRSSVLNSVYTRSVSIACFTSAAVGWTRYRATTAAYGTCVRAYNDACSPIASIAEVRADGHTAFDAVVLAAYALIVVPLSVADVMAMADEDQSVSVLVHTVVMYMHNTILCLCEWQFITLCYALRAKFAAVNRDAETIGRRIVDPAAFADDDDDDDDNRHTNNLGRNLYGRRQSDDSAAAAANLRTTKDNDLIRDVTVAEPIGCSRLLYSSDDNNDDLWMAQYDDVGNYVYRSRATGRLLADTIERLKIRHRLIREAVNDLKYAFTAPIGASLCNLCVMALFEIYDYNQKDAYDQKIFEFLIFGLAQYAFRFYTVVATAHAMTKQALRSKQILSFVNKHFLDIATKEELQAFFGQISSCSLEFTIYDLFTLNTQLFTSAIGACITYLVIILQVKSDYQQKYPNMTTSTQKYHQEN